MQQEHHGYVISKDLSDINGNQSSLIQETKNKAKVSVSYVFELSDESPVEVLIGEPTADQTTIVVAIKILC